MSPFAGEVTDWEDLGVSLSTLFILTALLAVRIMLVVDVIVGIPVSVLSKRSKDAVVAVRVPVTCQLPVM